MINSLDTIRILTPGEIDNINNFSEVLKLFRGERLNVNSIVRIGLPQDGSSLLHAIAQTSFKPYTDGYLMDNLGAIKALRRREFIRDLRLDLAEKAGRLREDFAGFANETDGMSNYFPNREELVKFLQSNNFLDERFHQFVAANLRKNLLVINGDTTTFFQEADTSTQKEANITVVLMLPNNYELIGFLETDRIQTLFPPDHPLIRALLS